MTAVSAVCLLSVSCSYVFVKGPPREPERAATTTCTTSYAAPAVDAVLALADVAGVLAVLVWASDSCPNDNCVGREYTLVPLLAAVGLPGAIFGSSAYAGIGRVRACRGAQTRLDAAARRRKTIESFDANDRNRASSGPASTGSPGSTGDAPGRAPQPQSSPDASPR